ncbi:MAG: hypothetical protein ACM3PY_18725 [Omnitrophica WOR_2 bacterium]
MSAVDGIKLQAELNRPLVDKKTAASKKAVSIFFNPFVILAFSIDLLTPYLIWKGLLPTSVRWLSHGCLLALVVWSYLRMLSYNRVPAGAWVVGLGTVLWGIVALYQGQGLLAVFWGWLMMFQFSMVGLFAYLQPEWPRRFPYWLMVICISILVFEVLFQIVEYLTGMTPGDNLDGSFGFSGSGHLMITLIVIYCLAVGTWLANRNWIPLVAVLFLGTIASLLGELKLFYVTSILILTVALLISLYQDKRFWKIVPYGLLAIIVLYGFVKLYDAVVPGAKIAPLESYITDPKVLNKYLNFTEKKVSEGKVYYNVGRNYALNYGWNSINRDNLVLLFGYGLGARAESQTLGAAGTGIQQGRLGANAGSSLLVMMQELGVVGLTSVVLFLLWMIATLIREIRLHPKSEANALRYGVLLFTLFWPLWAWYNPAWTLRVPMMIYWIAAGYGLGYRYTLNQKIEDEQ